MGAVKSTYLGGGGSFTEADEEVTQTQKRICAHSVAQGQQVLISAGSFKVRVQGRFPV